ncbi:MAG: FtsX-like permease family protein [Micrococcaceae bacterium]
MKNMALTKLVWKNFKQRKVRNLLVAFDFSIGLIGVFISIGLGNGVTKSIAKGFGDGSIPRTIDIYTASDSGSSFLLDRDKTELTKIIGKDNIDDFEMPVSLNLESLELKGKVLGQNEDTMGRNYFQVTQYLPDSKIQEDYSDDKKTLAKNKDESEGLAVPKSFLEDFNREHNTQYEPKDLIDQEITLNLVQRNPNEDIHAPFKAKVIKVFNDDGGGMGDSLYLTQNKTNELIATTGFTPQVLSAVVQVKDVDKIEDITDKVNGSYKYVAMSKAQAMKVISKFILLIQALLIATSAQAIFVSTLLLGIVLYINVIERTKEIGILKALGYHNSYISKMFIFESIFIAITAISFSLAVSSLIGVGINAFAKSQEKGLTDNVFVLPITGTILTIVGAMLVACLGSLVPARKASRLNTVDAFEV